MTFKNRGFQGFVCSKHNEKYGFICLKCLVEVDEN